MSPRDADDSCDVESERNSPVVHGQKGTQFADTARQPAKTAPTSGIAGTASTLGGSSTSSLGQSRVTPACGKTPSSYTEDSQFTSAQLPPGWRLNHGSSQPGTSLVMTKRGPASNPSLCASGCAVLAFIIPAGDGWGGGSIVDEWYATTTNLYGATVIANVALEVSRPHAPVNVRVYSQGDTASGYAWGATASSSTATLADLSTFHQIVLRPANRAGNRPYCASATGAIGIQVQRNRSSSVDIPVKLYIKSVVISSGSSNEDLRRGVGGQLGRGGGSSKDGSTNPRLGGFSGDGYCQLAKDGAISVASDDWVAAGTCQGYGYTYSYGNRADTKIVPACDASRCTPALSKISARGLCANGTIAADPSWKSKVGVGFDFDPSKAKTSGLALTYQMAGTAILRFQLDDGRGGYYCADLEETDENGVTVQLPWDSLTTRCWDRWDPGVAYNPSLPIKGMQLSASCLAAKTSWFDMCITGLSTY